jgi:hypothetical protein
MEVINREQEYNLIANHANQPIVHFGLQGKQAAYLHEGHAHMTSECRRIRPDAKLIVKIFTPFLELMEAGGYMDGGDSFHPDYMNKPYDREGILTWCEAQGIDYVLETSMADFAQWENDKDRVGTAIMLPTHNLDFDNLHKPFNEIVADADKIIAKDELDQYRIGMLLRMVRCHLIAALSGAVDYRVKASSRKDVFLNMAKDYIYKTYADYEEYLLIEPYRDDTGVPVSSSTNEEFTSTDKEKIKVTVAAFKNGKIKETWKWEPKWLKGKTLYELDYQLPSGSWLALNTIK